MLIILIFLIFLADFFKFLNVSSSVINKELVNLLLTKKLFNDFVFLTSFFTSVIINKFLDLFFSDNDCAIAAFLIFLLIFLTLYTFPLGP